MLDSTIIFFLFLSAFSGLFQIATGIMPVLISLSAMLLIARYITKTVVKDF